jgi:acyl-coenzyme A thioesterase 9
MTFTTHLRDINFRRLIISILHHAHEFELQFLNGCLLTARLLSVPVYLNQVSNTFYFTFTVRPEAKATKNGMRIRNVVPASEEEAHRILERMDAEALQGGMSM